jgi:hypothetical protein
VNCDSHVRSIVPSARALHNLKVFVLKFFAANFFGVGGTYFSFLNTFF